MICALFPLFSVKRPLCIQASQDMCGEAIVNHVNVSLIESLDSPLLYSPHVAYRHSSYQALLPVLK